MADLILKKIIKTSKNRVFNLFQGFDTGLGAVWKGIF
jgi:hypothetical protein